MGIVEGDHVVEMGESGLAMYIIMEGSAALEHNTADSSNESVELLGEGDSFGEEIVLRLAELYAYSVIATSSLKCWSISEDPFQACFHGLPAAVFQMRSNYERQCNDHDHAH